jgi:lysophospholipase L1-like esterase
LGVSREGRGQRLAPNLLLLVLSTVIALGIAEALFRWHTSRTFDRDLPEWSENLVVVRGAQVFAFKPHASGEGVGSVDMKRKFPYRTNAHGLRDRDRPAEAPRTTRVLVIGDSYTWGYAIAEEESFPQVAERLLAERGRADIEVINGGVPDYNSRQERALLEKLMPIYQPDVVVLAYVVNDAEPTTSMPRSPDEVYRHSRSWFLTELAEQLNRRLFRRRLLPSARDNFSSIYLDGFEEDSVKWRDSREAIREMRDLAAAAGSSFTVLMMPDFTQPFDDGYGLRRIHDAVARWGRELNIPVFDLLELFRGEDHSAFIVPWDGHPNPEAHRRIAVFLVDTILEERNLTPSP